MTPDEHERIGLILGFPRCCIDEWISDLDRPHPWPGAGVVRGSIVEHRRSESERQRLNAEIGREFLDEGDVKHYVPCWDHVQTRGWMP